MADKEQVVLQTELEGLKLFNRGKVRDIYDLGEHLLIVASDRVSAFDVILPTPIPYKGKVLTALTQFWLEMLEPQTDNHLVTADVNEMGDAVKPHADILRGRSMLVKKAEILPIECVVRGYLAGSGWKEYQESGTVCGISLPDGLRESDKLPEPIFTPSTKATSGHDENINFERAVEEVGEARAGEARDKSIAIYGKASEYAATRGIIICDTKFEWGVLNGEMILADEALTPDSSRFWPEDQYQPGRSQPSFDKQFVRDYLIEIGWDKEPPAPELPDEIVRKTSEKYLQAYQLLTGRESL